MNAFVVDNWPLIVAGALIALVVLSWVILASRRTRVALDRRDTLDEGAAPAARNQALIDAAPGVAPLPPLVTEEVSATGVPAAGREAHSADSDYDDLTRIKGLGPKLASTLQQLGVTSFGQIAAWDEAEIERIDGQLGRFQGRIRRDAWVDQARLLAAGDQNGFESRFGAQ
jgi:predicted flap endonuclease-1-like 5' DNA nuclease